jgi:type II secretory pathway component PulM
VKHLDEISNAMAPLVAKIDTLSLRERLLVLVTALVLIVALWHTLLMQPLEQRASQTRAELTALEDRITAANRSLEEQILQLAGGGDEQRLRIDWCASAIPHPIPWSPTKTRAQSPRVL